MDFSELAERTRSIRRFVEEREVSRGELESMVEIAGLAPCAANLQRSKFLIVTEREDRERLFPALKWAAYLRDWNGPRVGERPSAYIVICAPEDEHPFTGMDVGIAASYLVLAAAEQGIGACMILSFDRAAVEGLVSDTSLKPRLVVALGHPGEQVVLEHGREEVDTGGTTRASTTCPSCLCGCFSGRTRAGGAGAPSG